MRLLQILHRFSIFGVYFGSKLIVLIKENYWLSVVFDYLDGGLESN